MRRTGEPVFQTGESGDGEMPHTAAVGAASHAARVPMVLAHPDVSSQQASPAAAQLPPGGLWGLLGESRAGAAYRFLLSDAETKRFGTVPPACPAELKHQSVILSWWIPLVPLQ